MKLKFLCDIENINQHSEINKNTLLVICKKRCGCFDFERHGSDWLFSTFDGEFKKLYTEVIIDDAMSCYDSVFVVDFDGHNTDRLYRIHHKEDVKNGCYRSSSTYSIGYCILKDHNTPYNDCFLEYDDHRIDSNFFEAFSGRLYCALESKEN